MLGRSIIVLLLPPCRFLPAPPNCFAIVVRVRDRRILEANRSSRSDCRRQLGCLTHDTALVLFPTEQFTLRHEPCQSKVGTELYGLARKAMGPIVGTKLYRSLFENCTILI